MDNIKKISLVAEDGSIEEVEKLTSFKFKDTGKEYLVYTKNDRDEKGLITVHVARVERNSNEITLLCIEDDEEWNSVKDVLRTYAK